ncbi:calcium uniporter regulatory subunit MCUb, mitochondrial isoform 1-T1 [Geothlypis trichas]
MDLFSSLIGILHMLVAEGNFLPSCKLQPVGESLGLSAESRVVRVLFWGFFFWSVPNVIHICQRIFFSVLSADILTNSNPRTSQVGLWRHTGGWRGREGAPYSTLVPSDEVTINYRHGLPVITLMLPTRSERCQFTVKPVVTTVGAFLQDVKREDKGIERAEVFAADGSKVSDATLMAVLLMNDFKLVINNTAYSVSPPVKDKLSSEHATEMEDIKSLVHKLFVALHLEDHQIRKERELLQKVDHLKGELLPLEQMKASIMDSADAKTSRLLWVGLALMSTQGGALAWLTWWVYSWDIMEPVTYFITYGSAMAFYAYFVLTKQDFIYPHAKDRQFLHYFYRKSKKQRFNVERYNKLKDDLAEAEESLRRLRQPLRLRLPIQEINDKD